MLASNTFFRRSAPVLAKQFLQRQVSVVSMGSQSFRIHGNFTETTTTTQRQLHDVANVSAAGSGSLHRHMIHRSFAAAFDPSATFQKEPGHVTKKLRVLDMGVVKEILAELRSVDTNSDGRYVAKTRSRHF
jgi:hypothetical protein